MSEATAPIVNNAERVKTALSDLVGISGEIIAPNPRPRERLQQLAELRAKIADVKKLLLEGGNPIGPEAEMLIEVLTHVEEARKHLDWPREEIWRAIAIALHAMVRGALADALDLTAVRASDEGRFR